MKGIILAGFWNGILGMFGVECQEMAGHFHGPVILAQAPWACAPKIDGISRSCRGTR